MGETITSKKFKNAIGGIEVSIEEKEKNLQIIKSAIKINNEGTNKPVEISHQIFSKSYPESLDLVKDYYDSLFNAKVKNIVAWNGSRYINKYEQIQEYRIEVKKTMKDTLIIFCPELIKKDVLEIKNKFGLTTNEITSMFNNYKKIINEKKRIRDLNEENKKYDIAKLIYKEIVINGMKKSIFCKTYNISGDSINSHLEILKEIDKKLYDEVKKTLNNNIETRFILLKNLIEKIGNYTKNKIKINTANGEKTMPFTILDYYSLTKYPVKKTIEFAKNPRNYYNATKEERINRALALKMLETQKSVGQFISKQQLMNKKMAIGTTEKMIEMNEEICDNLFELFEQENIPKSQTLMEIAFKRYALGQPILPLKQLEQIIILEDEKEENIEQVKGKNK